MNQTDLMKASEAAKIALQARQGNAYQVDNTVKLLEGVLIAASQGHGEYQIPIEKLKLLNDKTRATFETLGYKFHVRNTPRVKNGKPVTKKVDRKLDDTVVNGQAMIGETVTEEVPVMDSITCIQWENC